MTPPAAFDLTGRAALVTGAAGGIGAAAARALLDAGARVMLTDVDERRLADTAAALGDSAACIPLDVTDRAGWDAAVAAAVTRFGALHILVNNAGISEPGDIESATEESWNRHLAVNLQGPFHGIRAAAPAIKAAGGGSIVNVSSMLALRPGAPFVAYCASKAGLAHMTKSAALHFANSGIPIRVNCVCPGSVETPMMDRYAGLYGATREEGYAAFAAIHPMGRVGTAAEVAAAILFLASDASGFTTGIDLPVDGGAHIRDS